MATRSRSRVEKVLRRNPRNKVSRDLSGLDAFHGLEQQRKFVLANTRKQDAL